MPTDRNRALDLDDHTARLGRELFAEVRQQQRDAAAEERRARSHRDDGTDGSLWDALFGDGDADGGDGGDGD